MTIIAIPRDPANARKRNVAPMPGWGREAGGAVWVRCKCGLPMDLDHQVAGDGTVAPSLWHDDAACGWHVHARLEGWRP